ncbi:AMP-binding protein [Actinokineospora xionganensis]|uniref:AMP-binding protein n=1 Tax=Actinokineospora xionganensis TaxID=2684470 RepID=UPI001C9BC781|nr:AMP-binding protein [Actinokineospora xionganensis]
MELLSAPVALGVPFVRALADFGDRVAVVTREGSLTYRELAERVESTADTLGTTRRLVLVATANDVDSLVTYLAALRGGHPVLLTGSQVDELTAAYDPDVVHTATGLHERRTGTAHDLHPDLALLLSTSGSTGSPKLVRLSAANVQANAESIASYLDIRETDRAAMTLPMHYCYGLSVINSNLARGAALLLSDHSVVDKCFWETFRAHGGTSLHGVPYTFDLLDRAGFADRDLPSLRYVTQAGGRLAPAQVRRYAALGAAGGWRFFVMYGQTEATARMAYLPPDLAATRPEAIGVPIPGGSFEIRPDGELVYRGPNVMMGYARTPADLALGATLGALPTGDLARRAPDGLYEVIGRKSRFVKLFGLRVDLDEIEKTLVAAGFHAATTGDDATLIIALTHGQDIPAAVDVVRSRAGLPNHVIEVREYGTLPRLSTGKLDYAAIQTPTRHGDATHTLDPAARGAHLPATAPRPTHSPGEPPCATDGATCPAQSAALTPSPRHRGPHTPAPTPDHPHPSSCPHTTANQDHPSPRPDRLAKGRPPGVGRGLRDGRSSRSKGSGESGGSVRGIYRRALNRVDIPDDATFVSLGGDSLTYVRASIDLERLLGHVPEGWHTMPVRDLEAASVKHGRLRSLETNIALRALAITLIVATHIGLTQVWGGAHLLLVIAGWSFARFAIAPVDPTRMAGRIARAAARIAVPSSLWLAWRSIEAENVVVPNVLLVNNFVQSGTIAYWYVEVLVQILVLMALLFAVPMVRRLAVTNSFALAAGMLILTLIARVPAEHVPTANGFSARDMSLHGVLWLFVLGWLVQRAATPSQRVAAVILTLLVVPGYFDDPIRDAIVVGGLLLVLFVPQLQVPGPLVRLSGLLAGGSLYVYLTHYVVFLPLLPLMPAWAVLVITLAVGVAVWRLSCLIGKLRTL